MFMSAWWSGARRRGRGRWRVAAGAVLALVAASVLRVPGGARRERVQVPRVRPAPLAHLLADFTAHPHGAGAGGAGWRLEEEGRNATWWWYRVSFPCGARCAGEARVAAAALRVSQRVTLCTALPLLPSWLSYCDDLEVESEVSPAPGGEGSVLEERASARCGAVRVLAGACARLLDAHQDARRAALMARASL